MPLPVKVTVNSEFHPPRPANERFWAEAILPFEASTSSPTQGQLLRVLISMQREHVPDHACISWGGHPEGWRVVAVWVQEYEDRA